MAPYLTNMRISSSSKGRVVIPADFLERDGIRPGDAFDIQRLEQGKYLLQRRPARSNQGVIDWLLGCPEKGYFTAIDSESTGADARNLEPFAE